MNNRLLALVSLIATIGAVGIYSVNQGTTRADLLAAGAGTDCNPIPVACEGLDSDGGYRTLRTRALLCRGDAGTGVILPPSLTRHFNVFRPELCRRLATTCTDPSVCTPDDGGDAPEASDTPTCACSSGSACFVPADDGGTQPAPLGSTLNPGWSGAGCQPKACGVMSGPDLSWPDACPLDGGG